MITQHCYTGYLKPWLHFIHNSYQSGKTTVQIAHAVYKKIKKNPEKLPDYYQRHRIIPYPSSSMVYYAISRTRPDLIVKPRLQIISKYPTEPRWRLVLAPALANAQGRWERMRAMYNMRMAGLTLKEIGLRFNISTERVRQLINSPQVKQPSPLERYLKDNTPLRELAKSPRIRRWVTSGGNK